LISSLKWIFLSFPELDIRAFHVRIVRISKPARHDFPQPTVINICNGFGLTTILLNIWFKGSFHSIFEIKKELGQRQTHTRIISKD